jgi:hypothetical protein
MIRKYLAPTLLQGLTATILVLGFPACDDDDISSLCMFYHNSIRDQYAALFKRTLRNVNQEELQLVRPHRLVSDRGSPHHS